MSDALALMIRESPENTIDYRNIHLALCTLDNLALGAGCVFIRSTNRFERSLDELLITVPS